MGYDIVLSDHVLDYLTIHGKSMATTNDEFTETALQRLSKTEKRFNLTRNHRFVVLPSSVKSVRVG